MTQNSDTSATPKCNNCFGEKGFWIDRKDPRNSTYMHDNDNDEFQECEHCKGTGLAPVFNK